MERSKQMWITAPLTTLTRSFSLRHTASVPPYPDAHPSPLLTLLRLCTKLLPGDYLKTTFYLHCIAAPRRLLRTAIMGFYRMEHIYTVLREVKALYKGDFSILEFGTSDGYAFTKMLYATHYLGMDNRCLVHAFDS